MLKKFWTFLKTFGFGIVEKEVLDKGSDFLHKTLEDYYAKKPKACAALVSSAYVWVDTVVEDLAQKTETKYDDDAVAEVKKELEAFAADKGFELTNLDND